MILVRDGIGNRDLGAQLRRYAKQLQRCRIHGYLFAAFGHPSGSGGGIAPFGAVGIHVADLCRGFGKDTLRSDTDHLPYPRSLHLWVGSDAFRLLGGNILKGAMRIAAYLPKLVGFITGVQRQDNGEHGSK